MPLADALAVWAEEGRVFKRENNDESLNRRYQSLVSQWGNPFLRKQKESRRKSGWGTRGTETSKYPKEKKTIVMALVAASESATV